MRFHAAPAFIRRHMLEDTASGQLVAKYGYLAVLAGTMLEGETVVLAAGFFAHQGYLSIPWIIVLAIIGSTISDQGLFFLSRFKGATFLARFPKAAAKARAMSDNMCAKPVALTAFALFFRFLYGLRNIAPIFLGMSAIPTLKFMALNAVGAVMWATVFSFAGYAFARVISSVLGTLAKVEGYALLLLVVGSASYFAHRRIRRVRELDHADRRGEEAASVTEAGKCPPGSGGHE